MSNEITSPMRFLRQENIRLRDENHLLGDEVNDLHRYIRALQRLQQTVQHFTPEQEILTLLDETLYCAMALLNANDGSLLLINEETDELVFVLVHGVVREMALGHGFDRRRGIAGWVARHGKPLIVNDVSKDPRFNKSADEITGFVTRSIICVPLIVQRKTIGAIEVLNKLDGSDFTEQDLEALVPVASTAAMAIENARLHQTVLNAYKNTIKALAAAIDAKDPYTCGHSQRVMEYALLGAMSLSLPEEELEVLEYAGVLHDIGKIAVADSILNKPDSLTSKEWNIVREHPLIGANMLRNIPFLEKASKLILHHHERFDGKGYPEGLKGEDIPVGSRLIGVADAFDTMTTNRSYRAALTVDYTISELYGCAGTQFCPVAVEAFVSGFHANTDGISRS